MMIYKCHIVETPIQIILCFINCTGWALDRGETRQDTSLSKQIDETKNQEKGKKMQVEQLQRHRVKMWIWVLG